MDIILNNSIKFLFPKLISIGKQLHYFLSLSLSLSHIPQLPNFRKFRYQNTFNMSIPATRTGHPNLLYVRAVDHTSCSYKTFVYCYEIWKNTLKFSPVAIM
jgi:hypothetical protein